MPERDNYKTCGSSITPGDPMEFFWLHVVKTDKCWLWTGHVRPDGYGIFAYRGGRWRAHRYVYEQTRGEITKGLDIDHLCRVRHCVNPAHLEVVTRQVNILRGIGAPAFQALQTHCKNGHEFSEWNTIHTKKYSRVRDSY